MVTTFVLSAPALPCCSMPPLIVVPPVYVLAAVSCWVPVPLITRLIVPSVPPPAITPPNVLELPVGLRVRIDAVAVELLMTLPAAMPTLLSEAICWLAPFKSSAELTAMETAVVTGSGLLPPGITGSPPIPSPHLALR